MNKLSKTISLLSCIFLTASCGEKGPDILNDKKADFIDPELGLSRDDYQHPYKSKSSEEPNTIAEIEPPVPDLAEVLAMPQPPKLGETKLVSIAVTDDVPLKDVFVELARMADVDIEVDAGITGGVSFRAKDRPFNEVIDRLTDLAGLRYSMKNGVLRVERDTPYVQDYPINFLNVDRTANGSFNINSTGAGSSSNSSGSGSGGNGGNVSNTSGSGNGSNSSNASGTNTGSTSSVASKSESDFWKQFNETIKQILAYTPTKRVSGAGIAKQPDAPPTPQDASAAPASASALAVDPAAPPSNNGAQTSEVTPSSPDKPSKPFYIMNRQASTLTVSGTDRQHEMIRQFLRMIQENSSSQVLIEAKIVEVTLNDTYQTGINWTKFGGKENYVSANLSTVKPTVLATSPAVNILQKNIFDSKVNLTAAVNLLDEFGTTRALSSPRLHAMNNQKAVLSFAEGLVYFNVKVSSTDPVLGSTGQVVTAGQFSVTSTQQTTPVGIVLTLQPVIDSKTNEVTLDIHPTLTRLVKYINDPGFEVSKAQAIAALASNTSSGTATAIDSLQAITSPTPEIETREMDSVVKIKSGQALVIGGLLEDSVTDTDAGVPIADEIPWFGNLFKSVNKTNSKKELVIFLRATIIGSSNPADKADRAIYEKFGNDPRPLNFSQ